MFKITQTNRRLICGVGAKSVNNTFLHNVKSMFGHFSTLCMKGLTGYPVDDYLPQLAFTCSKLTVETPAQGMKYVQS